MTENCIICNSKNLNELDALPFPFLIHRMFNDKHFDKEYLYHCKDCDFYWTSFRPNDEESNRYYKNYMESEYISARDSFEPGFTKRRNDYDNQNGFDTECRVRKSLMKSLFSKYIDFSKIEKVLDYGGARGEFIIDEFSNAQKFVYDIDSITPVNESIKKINREELLAGSYDFIQCCHMLEHVSNPIDFINEILSLLKIEGYLYIEVPYEDLFIKMVNKTNSTIQVHEHINFFSKLVFEKIFDNPNYIILENSIIEQTALFGQSKIISCLVKRVEPSNTNLLFKKVYEIQAQNDLFKQEFLNKASGIQAQNDLFKQELLNKFSELQTQNDCLMSHINSIKLQLSSLNEENLKMNDMIKKYISRPTFLQQIFSVKNEGKHKVVRLLGLKIKFWKKTKSHKRYVIWAPPYEKSNGIRALYKLCEELNNFGYDAQIFSGPPFKDGVRYLPELTQEMKENDIVIYPEALPGNPLEFKRVVRWVLFYPGEIGGDTKYEKNEIIFSWLKDYYDAPLLQVQHLDHNLFYVDKNIIKDTDSYFVYKGGQCRTFPELENAVKITYDYPQTREELAKLLKRTKTLYSFDDKTALNDEALLCGAKVKIVTLDGMYEHTTTEEVSYDIFKNEIENFIKITQDENSWKNKHFLPRWFFYKISTPTHTKLIFFGFIKIKYRRKIK